MEAVPALCDSATNRFAGAVKVMERSHGASRSDFERHTHAVCSTFPSRSVKVAIAALRQQASAVGIASLYCAVEFVQVGLGLSLTLRDVKPTTGLKQLRVSSSGEGLAGNCARILDRSMAGFGSNWQWIWG